MHAYRQSISNIRVMLLIFSYNVNQKHSAQKWHLELSRLLSMSSIEPVFHLPHCLCASLMHSLRQIESLIYSECVADLH